MAFGGGTWTTQNKVLPGAYINFISAARTSVNLSDRGVATCALAFPWGPEGEMLTISNDDLQTNSLTVLGYPYTADELKPFRDMFATGLRTLYFYNLNSGGTKASNTYATAKYPGTRGNALSISIQKGEAWVDTENEVYDVTTYLDGAEVDVQSNIKAITDLVGNDFVDFASSGALTETAGTPLTNGVDGTAQDANHQSYLDKAESYQFNAMICDSDDETIKQLYVAYNKRMRDEVGAKFQTILHRYPEADYEGVISVINGLVGDDDATSAVYWVGGAEAAAAINRSICATDYVGEYDIDVDYTQTELEEAIGEGQLVFHRAGEVIQVLSDINTFTSFTTDKNEDFSENQVIRVLDQIAIDIASLFNTRYRDLVQNDNAGRMSLWADIVAHHNELQRLRAIQNFDSANVTVEQGNLKKSVVVTDAVTPVVAMKQLYMTVIVQ